MSFVKPNPPGWAAEEEITSTQMNSLQDQLVQAVDGVGGGSYAANLTFSGALTITGATTFSNITATGVNRYKLASRSLTRVFPFTSADLPTTYAASPAWRRQSSQNGNWIQQTLVAERLIADIRVPDGSTITDVFVYYVPPIGHASIVTNFSFPTFDFKSVQITDLSATGHTTHGTATDSSPGISSYENRRTFGLTGLSVTATNSTHLYTVCLLGEQGSNAMTGGAYRGVAVTFTTAAQDDGAA
ncbi:MULTISPECIES: hypothetical protein [Sorangium]|uniref:Uncharacterized protein n=1 Tax=Sorangium cellulosum TaxID=56 RepID=A0A4P2QPB5_SORCE|nr:MULTISPECIES: hypothetical protein [Sorangium]AUX31915.1 uncharacterized protein SOCE836_040500 [Sorangium cellulosum]WCQ91289.1 hypothetical protein NQZ70_04005 [Sorangium sp. Soce836]